MKRKGNDLNQAFYLSNEKIPRVVVWYTLPETHMFAPENRALESRRCLSETIIFPGELLVLGSVGGWNPIQLCGEYGKR